MSQPLDERFRRILASWTAEGEAIESGSRRSELEILFEAQALSRHVDFAARDLQASGQGFYTISSAGHESNAAVALALRPTDPALLHYRSGGFYCARAAQVSPTADPVDPVRDLLLGLTSSREDPISGGRHKVFGNPALHVIPQTSTIASHLPRALGLAFALPRATRLGRPTPWPDDAIVVTSLGDASVNHSTALGALNAAGQATHRGLPLPLLVVVEDNGWGISVPSPEGWVEAVLSSRPGVDYVTTDGTDPVAALAVARDAVEGVRGQRRPVVLHLRTVRYLGHAGSDVEFGYRSERDIARDLDRDPLLGTARALLAAGWSPSGVIDAYDAARDRVARTLAEVLPARRLESAAEVVEPLRRRAPTRSLAPAPDRAAVFPKGLPEDAGPLTLAQSVNAALTDLLAACPEALVFGEDVGVKGGVYGVTRGLQRTFGARRVFDTLLDEQTILGLALGTSLAGLLPVAEIEYLAYLHNAEDQLRGEAATLGFFSDGQYANGMVVRIASFASLGGFGGHFHNDSALGVLRDVPGLLVACPSGPAEAPGLLHTLATLARDEGRVGVFLEPTALYHDRAEAAAYPAPGTWRSERDRGRVDGRGRDLLVVTFGNGVRLSRQALAAVGVATTILDLRWLVPLPVDHLLEVAAGFPRVLVVDETRRSGGVSEGVLTALVDGGYDGAISRVTAEDSFVPLGPAAAQVVLTEAAVVDALRRLG